MAMKKIYILFIFLFSVSLSYGQSGNGTSGDPYYGTISSTPTWSGTIYIGTSTNPDITIGNGGHLTISPGATLIFTQPASDLIITGTGQITANATSTNKITFTKASGNDHWGHITFQAMGSAGASLFNHCIIENGDVTSFSGSEARGGGLFIGADFDNVAITNSIIRNNKALNGGGICVDENSSPVISNTIMVGNVSDASGGAMLIRPGSNAKIENCLIYNNTSNSSTDYGGGGITFGANAENVEVINSVIVNNEAPNATAGDNVTFFKTDMPKLINCIIWGADNPIAYEVASPSPEHFTNCAVSNYTLTLSNSTNCIPISTTNGASDGPNFNAIDGSDWSIAFISPCRDKGSDTNAPSSDYNGNIRIGTTDIGAYEVQYSLWTGDAGDSQWSTATNWDKSLYPGSSGSTGDIIIPAAGTSYPTTGTPDYTLGSDNYLIIEPGAKATFGTLTNNAGASNLLIKSNSTGIGSLIHNSSGVNATSELYVKGGTVGTSLNYKWHYISSPFTSLSTDAFTGFTQNLAGYFEERPVSSDSEGWVAYDGYVYDGGTDNTYSFSTLNVGEGYNLYHSSLDHTFTLEGSLNTGDISIPLSYTTTNTGTWNGLNLAGNPYPSSIDWSVIDDGLDPDISQAIHFYRASDGSFVSWVNGVGTDGNVTGIVPPMQGFFIKTGAASTSIDLTASTDRTHGSQPRYKSNEIIPLIRLEFTDQELGDKTVIRFDDLATENFDNGFDASKFLIDESRNVLWTQLNGQKYSINGIPFPEQEFSIPLVINVPDQNQYTLKATDIQALNSYDIKLIDKLENNYEVDLKQISEYTFTSEAGTIDNRFIITVGNFATGLDDILKSDYDFNIYTFSGSLNIQNMSDEWNGKATINVYDITGRLVSKHTDQQLVTGGTIQLPFNNQKGIYLIEITDSTSRTVQKLSHR